MDRREELVERVAAAQRELRRGMAATRAPHPLMDVQLTMVQLKILLRLHRSAGLSSQDLARSTAVSPATMTGVVDRLVGQGLVERREDAADRRVRRLALTPEGAALAENVLSAGERHLRDLLDRLPPDDLEKVAQAFELLAGAAADVGSRLP